MSNPACAVQLCVEPTNRTGGISEVQSIAPSKTVDVPVVVTVVVVVGVVVTVVVVVRVVVPVVVGVVVAEVL